MRSACTVAEPLAGRAKGRTVGRVPLSTLPPHTAVTPLSAGTATNLFATTLLVLLGAALLCRHALPKQHTGRRYRSLLRRLRVPSELRELDRELGDRLRMVEASERARIDSEDMHALSRLVGHEVTDVRERAVIFAGSTVWLNSHCGALTTVAGLLRSDSVVRLNGVRLRNRSVELRFSVDSSNRLVATGELQRVEVPSCA